MLDTIPFASVHSNLEHGLAILTERFSPLRSVLHNLSCWSPKQKWCDKQHYSYFVTRATTRLIWFWAGSNQPELHGKACQMPSGKFHFYLVTKLNAYVTSETRKLCCYWENQLNLEIWWNSICNRSFRYYRPKHPGYISTILFSKKQME